jgi:hypothetical protein
MRPSKKAYNYLKENNFFKFKEEVYKILESLISEKIAERTKQIAKKSLK